MAAVHAQQHGQGNTASVLHPTLLLTLSMLQLE